MALSPNKLGVAVIFKKTVGLSPVKTRLAAGIGKENAEEFYSRSLLAVEETLLSVKQRCQSDLDLKFAVAEGLAMKSTVRKGFTNIYQGDGSLGQRLAHVYEQLADIYDFVLFLGGDCPQISAKEILSGIDSLVKTPCFVLGPAIDGGFWMWGGSKRFPCELWKRLEYSVSDTLRELECELTSYAQCQRLAIYRDGDEIEDLSEIFESLNNMNSPSRAQGELQRWLEKLV